MPDNPDDAKRELLGLRKTDPKRAFELAVEYERRWPDHMSLLGAVHWCRYDVEIRGLGEQSSDADLAAGGRSCRLMVAHYEQSGRPEVHAAVTSILKVAALLTDRGSSAPARDLLLCLSPEALASQGSGGFSSSRMRWLNAMTKSLKELGEWVQLVEIGSAWAERLESDEEGKWILHRVANAHEELGNFQRALELFDRAFPGPRAGWELAMKGRLLIGVGRVDDGIQHLRRALASAGTDLGMSVGDVLALASALSEVDVARARRHLDIAFTIRKLKGWKEDPRLIEIARGIQHTPVEIDADVIESERLWWRDAADAERLTGRVTKHLPGDSSGFIQGSDGHSYYFSRKRDDSRPLPAVGSSVTFEPYERINPKTGAMSKAARSIRPSA